MGAHIGKGVEGTLGRLKLDPVHACQACREQVAALVKFGCHGPHAIPRAVDRRQGTKLGKAADVACALALQGTGGRHHRAGAGQPADPPAGHRPALGETVDRKHPLGQVGGYGGQAVVAVTWRQ